ncbi:hypothetical protein SBF1_320034 [Candidatus Desulfosporosinus infrequens]|uniref:Uncharacterized protein n=1 Tax=Candidatus Desulfosporosinus infrequens TaxID=2043169 RepID=A0A2U3KZT9_9FIRM|nr:hypothetical protein SBF1_320034 [Candidatus Desulfosporosinus infrequens]
MNFGLFCPVLVIITAWYTVLTRKIVKQNNIFTSTPISRV